MQNQHRLTLTKKCCVNAVTITILLAATCLFSGGADKKQRKQKDYPLAIEVVETQSVENAHDLASVKASDGNLYTISCSDSGGGLIGILTDPHCSDVTLVPGTIYRARWEGGDLKVLISEQSRSHPKEGAFTVVRSTKMTADERQDCKVCVLDATSKQSNPTVSQNTQQPATSVASSAAAGDSVDVMLSDFHAWKSGSECDEHMSYRQCVAQVEAAIPILQRLNFEWKRLKSEMQTESGDPRTSQDCRTTVSTIVSTFDDYLSLQGELVRMYESVDPDAPDAKLKWEMANARYQELQQKEGSKLGDLESLYAFLKQDCPAD